MHPLVWIACKRLTRLQRKPDTRPLSERRAETQRAPAVPPRPDGLIVDELAAPVDGTTVRVRRYRPPGPGPWPAHVLAHGGSFWSGGLEQVDALAREYAAKAQCCVLSVEYRLAPEHRWPTAAEDMYAVVRWAAREADTLGIDARRLSVGGLSVGGGLAAVTALMARDRGGPQLVFQLLEIPVTDLTMSQPSVRRFATGHLLTRSALEEGYGLYVPNPADRVHGYASPLLAPDLSGLPPALVLTCEYDPLRDEGEAYARRLHEAGVRVRSVCAFGHVHSSTYVPGRPRSAARYRAMTARALRDALWPAGVVAAPARSD